ncbi:hypothetical protein H072_8244 [Dactylellina haptotyla CBS 200.50]|uniref:Uncharacterized protein n=1 Tax=Dactylellina haptotyla (strain CBS 200.50) TaxID=1284197 RepID=S8A5D6_DACHA|nr:hypothetical protein H072_8244 [Dactylellina haptotyla CBS 200.50]
MAVYFEPGKIEFALELEEIPDGEYEPKSSIMANSAEENYRSRSKGKRIKNLRISVIFTTERKSGETIDYFYDPDVRTVPPAGTYSMMPTDTSVEEKRAFESSLIATFGGVKAALKSVYELTQSKVTTDRITINGRTYSEYKTGDPDRCNAVEWHLFENNSQKSGIPTFFRTAVLLERRPGDTEKFTGVFSIRMGVDVLFDTKRWVKKVFGLGIKDEPVVFDLTKVEETRLGQFRDKLEPVPLEKECRFVTYMELNSDFDAETKTEEKVMLATNVEDG